MGSRNHSTGPEPATASTLERVWIRVRRHLWWARKQGIGRLIEEDHLDPIERASVWFRKANWRRTHDESPNAVPIFLVGVQRSGTNMLVAGFERSPLFDVFNENDRRAFTRFRLRPKGEIAGIVTASPHPFVLFKPLCDSDRVAALLGSLGTPSAGRALWVHRNVDDRARSAVAKFGDSNRRVLATIAAGRGDHLWQAQGLSERNRELLRAFDYSSLSPESAASLFWYVRNSIAFDAGLDDRPDVMFVSYDALVDRPEATLWRVATFLGAPYSDDLGAHIERRSSSDRPPLPIDGRIRELCTALQARLDGVTSTDEPHP